METKYSALVYAKYITVKYKEITGKDFRDEMKLHKLLYFLQRDFLSILNKPAFKESFEGWRLGPVIREFRYFHQYFDLDKVDNLEDGIEKQIAIKVMMEYSKMRSKNLSDLSHEEISWRNSRIGLKSSQDGNKFLLIEDIKKDAEKLPKFDLITNMYVDARDQFYKDFVEASKKYSD